MTTIVLGVLGPRGATPLLVDAEAPIARSDDLGLGRGDGCFETCRVVLGPDGVARIQRLDQHLERLAGSARALDLPTPDSAAWARLCGLVAGAWSRGLKAAGTVPGEESPEAALKLMLTRGVDGQSQTTGLAALSAIGPALLRQRVDGIRVVTLSSGRPSDAYADAPWLLGGVKSLSYAMNMAALREAARRGADDAIFVSTDGLVMEAPTATLVWQSEGVLCTTPSDGTGILVGTTQRALFRAARDAGLATLITAVAPGELVDSQGMWLVSSVRGVTEITHLDGVAITINSALTAILRQLGGFATAALSNA
jgi:4-amino-4-deoxychorismate lyase